MQFQSRHHRTTAGRRSSRGQVSQSVSQNRNAVRRPRVRMTTTTETGGDRAEVRAELSVSDSACC